MQENKIFLPNKLFTRKPWTEYSKSDPERDSPSKNTVHANNYGMGKRKFGLITGLPERYAEMIQGIYFALFPEVKTKYQAGIDKIAMTTKQFMLPNEPPRRMQFFSEYGDDLKREMYAMYAQGTVGDLLVDIFNDTWESLCGDLPVRIIHNPLTLPVPIKLQVHDSIGCPTPNDFTAINDVCKTIDKVAKSKVLKFDDGDTLNIPMDYSVGKNLQKYHKCSVKCPNNCKEENLDGLRDWIIDSGYKNG